METIITVVLSIATALVATWFVYRLFREKRPSVGPFRFVTAVSERKDATMKYDLIKIKVGLPASTSGDVVRRELTIRRAETADGVLEAAEVISTRMMELEIEAVQDSVVDLSCVAIDDADNRSEPKELTFTVADTVAPDLSGDFSIAAIGERTVGEDPVEPEPEEPADTDDPVEPEPEEPADADEPEEPAEEPEEPEPETPEDEGRPTDERRDTSGTDVTNN